MGELTKKSHHAHQQNQKRLETRFVFTNRPTCTRAGAPPAAQRKALRLCLTQWQVMRHGDVRTSLADNAGRTLLAECPDATLSCFSTRMACVLCCELQAAEAAHPRRALRRSWAAMTGAGRASRRPDAHICAGETAMTALCAATNDGRRLCSLDRSYAGRSRTLRLCTCG